MTGIKYEGITAYPSLEDFYNKSIKSLPATCKVMIPAIAEDVATGITTEQEILGANVSSNSVQYLVVASNGTKYYRSIGRVMTAPNMHYSNILANFKIKWDAYQNLKDKDAPKVPSIDDRDLYRNVIKWDPIFQGCLSRTYGSVVH